MWPTHALTLRVSSLSRPTPRSAPLRAGTSKGKVNLLLVTMDNAEDLLNLKLDIARNELLTANTTLAVAGASPLPPSALAPPFWPPCLTSFRPPLWQRCALGSRHI